LVATIARTVHHAHQRGILHRDLKPANILIDAEGQPHLTDFGLAWRVDTAASHASGGGIAGTPSYMAPEQAIGPRRALTTAVDVYGIGAILYELLGGQPPFQGGSAVEIIWHVVGRPPDGLRARDRAIDRDLETICLKCLEKAPERRYGSAEALAKDLERWLAHEPIRARRSTHVERLFKWARREPKLAAMAGVSVGSIILLIAALLIGFVRVNRSLARERQASYYQRIALAERAWSGNNDVGRTEGLLDGCRPDLRGWEWHYLRRLCHTELLTLRANSGRQPMAAALHPDGRRLATSGERGQLIVWDLGTGRTLWTATGHRSGVRSLAFSPDGRRLASAGHTTVKIWDPEGGREVRALPPRPEAVLSLAFSPDGRRLATATGKWRPYPSATAGAPIRALGEIAIWDLDAGQRVLDLEGHDGSVYRVSFSPDGAHLASGGADGMVRIWDATNGRLALTLEGHDGDVLGLSYSPGGGLLASAGADGTLRVWETATGRLARSIRDHGDRFFDVTFSPDGRLLGSAGQDWTVKLWDSGSTLQLATFRGHTKEVTGVAFGPDGRHLLSWGFDGVVKHWDTSRGQEAHVLTGHTREVYGVAFRPDGRRLASAGGDGSLIEWDAASGAPLRTLRGRARRLNSVAYSPDGKLIASGGDGPNIATVWDATTGRVVRVLEGHGATVTGVAFSPDGRLLASAGRDRTVRVWDLASGRETIALRDRDRGFIDVAFSPDGRRLAAGTGGVPDVDVPGRIAVWDATTWREVHDLRGHAGGISGLAFSPDGRRLASSSWDKTVKVWDTSTGSEVSSLRGQDLPLWDVAFIPDGRRLVAADNVGRLWFWDPATGAEAFTLRGHPDRVYSLAFSPDGRLLASAGRDKTVRLRDATPLGEPPHRDTSTPPGRATQGVAGTKQVDRSIR
jgi:WD40 repeat protein